jgi:FAD/FMN-containing dehydrogenase
MEKTLNHEQAPSAASRTSADGRQRHESRLGRIVRTWAINIANSLVFFITWGGKVLHEGRMRRGRWVDWYRAFECRPREYVEPTTEREICEIVREATKLRVVGAGHSFNSAPLTDEVLLSLDRYNKVSVREAPDRPGRKIAEVQAGVRLRDLNRILYAHGVGLSVAGSTNPQSIGGLIATDLHGTGRDHGFLSEALISLRIVDAAGNARTFKPGDEVFHAAIGGAGTCGVVTGAEILCEPVYNLAKAVKVVKRHWAEAKLDQLVEENTHLSFYYFGGLARSQDQEEDRDISRVRMNKWNRTIDPPDRLAQANKVSSELFDMIFSGHLIGLARALHVADLFARLSLFLYELGVNHRAVVHPADRGFARLLYFRHDEIEYGIPYESFKPCMDEVRKMLTRRHFPTIVEVRFTPDHSQALLGPGVGRRTAYIELAPSMSRPTDEVFQEFEQIVLRHHGQPHLGKKIYIDARGMEEIYGREKMERFRAARRAQDPTGKFLNAFTERLLA